MRFSAQILVPIFLLQLACSKKQAPADVVEAATERTPTSVGTSYSALARELLLASEEYLSAPVQSSADLQAVAEDVVAKSAGELAEHMQSPGASELLARAQQQIPEGELGEKGPLAKVQVYGASITYAGVGVAAIGMAAMTAGCLPRKVSNLKGKNAAWKVGGAALIAGASIAVAGAILQSEDWPKEADEPAREVNDQPKEASYQLASHTSGAEAKFLANLERIGQKLIALQTQSSNAKLQLSGRPCRSYIEVHKPLKPLQSISLPDPELATSIAKDSQIGTLKQGNSYGGAVLTESRALAKGGFGTVTGHTFVAKDGTEVRLAFKEQASQLNADDEANMLEMFKGDSNFLQLYGRHKHKGQPVLVTNEADATFDVHVERHGLTPQAFSDAVRILKRLEEKKVVHGDIKPKNLFALNGRMVLGDMGTAKIGEPTAGTLFYVRGTGHARDIYAMGVSLTMIKHPGLIVPLQIGREAMRKAKAADQQTIIQAISDEVTEHIQGLAKAKGSLDPYDAVLLMMTRPNGPASIGEIEAALKAIP